MAVFKFPPKDPSEILDYQFDWAALNNDTGLTNWLAEGETILTHAIEATSGITVMESSLINNDTCVLVWIGGGTPNTVYSVTCEITTATRTGVRTAILPVIQR